MIVRAATAEDCEAVFPLARAFATSFAVEQAAFEETFAQLLTHPEVFFAVAEVEGNAAYFRKRL